MTRLAIIDLGTNTFQLLIAETQAAGFTVLHDSSMPAKIGEGGISSGKITEAAMDRAVAVLREFRQINAPSSKPARACGGLRFGEGFFGTYFC